MSYSKNRKGLFASVPAPAFVFLSAHALGSEDEISSWKSRAHVRYTDVLANTVPSLKSGLEKQYKIQQSLFSDKNQSQAE